VRGVERLSEPGAPLAVISDRAAGTRLSDLLARVDPDERPLDITSALRLTRQLAAALAALHAHGRTITHGAIAPERLIVTANARLLVADYALGSALERLEFSIDRYWTDLRVALPPHIDPPRLNERVDVLQMGLVALALVLGRPLTDEDFPSRIPELVASAWAVSSRGGLEPLPSGIRRWLVSALQLDPRAAFATVEDARTELDAVVTTLDLGSSNLETLLATIEPVLAPPRAAATTAPPAAPVVSEQPATARADVASAAAPVARQADRAEDPLSDSEFYESESDPIIGQAAIPDHRRIWIAAAVAVGVLALSGAWAWSTFTSGSLPTTTVPTVADGVPEAAAGIAEAPAGSATGQTPPSVTPVLAGLVAGGSEEPKADPPAPVAPIAAPAAPASGWITITAPIHLELMENGSVIGSNSTDRVSIGAGQHEIELVNDSLGYRSRHTVSVRAGQAAVVTVPVPTGTLSVNAQPWAEVWIGGERIGDTPLANVTLPIGTHQVVLRHPELGERVHDVTVTLKEGARLSVDLRTPR
jgi:hypothetical protein